MGVKCPLLKVLIDIEWDKNSKKRGNFVYTTHYLPLLTFYSFA